MEGLRTGKINFELSPTALHKVIDQIKFIFHSRLAQKNVTLEITGLEDDFPDVLAESSTLTNSVLANIVSNAIKFSASGDTINLNLVQEDEYVRIEISDQNAP